MFLDVLDAPKKRGHLQPCEMLFSALNLGPFVVQVGSFQFEFKFRFGKDESLKVHKSPNLRVFIS